MSTVAFDHKDRFRRSVDPLGRISEWNLNDANREAVLRHSSGEALALGFDQAGRLTRMVDPAGRRYGFEYAESFDAVTAFSNARDVPIRFERDAKANLTALRYADGKSEGFGYGPRGELIRWQSPLGHALQFGYDEHGLLIRKNYASGKRVEFQYDRLYNVTNITEVFGNERRVMTLDYDALGRLTRLTDTSGRAVEYGYDAAGRRSWLRTHDGFELNYQYDAEGRLARLANQAGATVAEYQYDAAGRLTSRRLAYGGLTTYAYDQASQLLRVQNQAPDKTTLSQFDYQYDASGWRVRVGMREAVLTLGYDQAGQVVWASNSVHGATQYAYDPAGNRVSQVREGETMDYTVNPLDQYTSAGQDTLTYDAAGNLAGRKRGAETWSYAYDEESRLVGMTGPGGNWQFEYDALGQQVASVHDGKRTEYLLDPFGLGQVIGEYDGAGQAIAHYAHGLGLVSRVDAQGRSAYYYFDGQGNTSELVSEQGGVLNQYGYGVFGEPVAWNETTPNAFCFVGEWGVMHAGAGLYYMRARHYDSGLGRFLQRDPVGINGGFNLYQYARNNPCLWTDPEGTQVDNLQLALDEAERYRSGKYLEEVANKTKDAAIYGAKKTATIIGVVKSPIIKGTKAYMDQFHPHEWYAIKETVWWMVNPFNKIEYVFDTLFGSSQGPDACGSSAGTKKECSRVATTSTTVVGSEDPNDITGPAGYGEQSYIVEGLTMRYLIRFENKTNATAAAQVVVVTNLLSSTLDWGTFELGDMGFGSAVVLVPSGRDHYATRVDAVGSLGVFVDISAELDPTNGMVLWTFRSIDPVTGGEPEDPFAGFLPPNINAPAGEGWVRYSIRPRPDIAQAAVIPALASIVFDTNEKIDTPTYRNTIDRFAPTSAVQPLPAQSPPQFVVSWSGQDLNGAGVASYDIYVSTNAGPFGLWQAGTIQTSNTFNGSFGTTYHFFSVARDYLGQLEAPPSSPDATTTIGVPTTRPELSIALVGGFTEITLRGETGKSYDLQVASNLATPNPWTTATKITLITPTQTWRETQPANQPQRLYRAVQSP